MHSPNFVRLWQKVQKENKIKREMWTGGLVPDKRKKNEEEGFFILQALPKKWKLEEKVEPLSWV